MTTYEAVAAGVRGTIAAHAQAQDDGRTEDIVALYTPDGVLDVPGVGTYEGTDAIRAAWDEWKPNLPQRHMVTNTVITDWTDDEARATSDVVYIQLGDSGWSIQIVARYHDTFRDTDGTWLLSRRAEEWVGWQPPGLGS
jgi:ketosteroid isomerase-like protein